MMYKPLINEAVSSFWNTRALQLGKQQTLSTQDTGARGAVTGGKHLDGFLRLLKQVALDAGIPEGSIHLQRNYLPGYFRPTKNWDFIVLSPTSEKQLLVAVELKSQVGSFGNNFNNRTEEAIGSAVDLWTAYREGTFPAGTPPWVGYLMLVEDTEASRRIVSLSDSHFPIRPEWQKTSYLDRYTELGQKLIRERHYTNVALLATQADASYSSPHASLAIEKFLLSLYHHLKTELL